MSETNLGLHQVDCSRCADQRRQTICASDCVITWSAKYERDVKLTHSYSLMTFVCFGSNKTWPADWHSLRPIRV